MHNGLVKSTQKFDFFEEPSTIMEVAIIRLDEIWCTPFARAFKSHVSNRCRRNDHKVATIELSSTRVAAYIAVATNVVVEPQHLFAKQRISPLPLAPPPSLSEHPHRVVLLQC